MRLALFIGCKIPAAVPAYETSARAVLARLGVELVALDFGCCGYPQRSLRLDAYLLLAARNLALAAARRLDVLTLCQCCYGSLRSAQHLLAGDGQRFEVELDRSILHARRAVRIQFQLRIVRRYERHDAARAHILEDRLRQRRAFDRIGARAELIEKHQVRRLENIKPGSNAAAQQLKSTTTQNRAPQAIQTGTTPAAS